MNASTFEAPLREELRAKSEPMPPPQTKEEKAAAGGRAAGGSGAGVTGEAKKEKKIPK